MRVDPAIAAMRGDRTPQRGAQAAMIAACEAWRAEARVAPIFEDLERYGSGAMLAECPGLARLFGQGEEAAQFAGRFSAVYSAALAGEPFGQVPFRHNFDGALSTLLLARTGAAQLTLTALEPGDYETASVTFSDADRHDAIIAGTAQGRATECSPDGALVHREVRLEPGRRLALDLSREAVFVGRVERRLVTLRLHRTASAPGPMREYALADGALLQQAAGAIGHSRHEMMLALLGRMKRREAAPLMAEMAAEAGPDSLRWEALREALALDTAQGFVALCRVARSALDPLAAPAGALRAQLIEAHPQLRVLEEAQCRA
jgi:hypothetical protein